MSTAQRLNSLYRTHEIQAKIAKDFDELCAVDESAARRLVSDLATLLGVDATAHLPATAPVRQRPQPVYEKIARLFAANGNVPMTKAAIAAATETPGGSVHTLVYGPQSVNFVRESNPAGGKEKIFRLTEQALVEAKNLT